MYICSPKQRDGGGGCRPFALKNGLRVIKVTIQRVIDSVRNKKIGYDISDEKIIEYINNVEMNLIIGVIGGREGDLKLSEEFGGYDINTDRDKKLLAQTPYDAIYETYCCTQIDLVYEEGERYQNDMIIFNQLLAEFSLYWAKTHRQKRKYNYCIGG